MWTYEQGTGWLKQDGILKGKGYSGWDDGDNVPEPGEGKNNPSVQHIKGIGPVPRGRWKIQLPPFFHQTAGPFTMRLIPMQDTPTFGRDGFLIHGDSLAKPGAASHGCIILARSLRMLIADSGDTDLEVVE